MSRHKISDCPYDGDGNIMGLLHQHGQGLLLPMVANSTADYFIFAVIARQGAFKPMSNDHKQ